MAGFLLSDFAQSVINRRIVEFLRLPDLVGRMHCLRPVAAGQDGVELFDDQPSRKSATRIGDGVVPVEFCW
jgi:hypothetical protein